MSDAPIDLANLKDDLGITDTSQDEWLQRRVNGLWSRIERYTERRLCAPPAAFVDDWSLVVENGRYQPLPPVLSWPTTASVFLRYFPVASIDAIEISGSAATAGDVRFEPKTGKLVGLRGEPWAYDLSHCLAWERVKITYTAGWAEVPADLYEVVLGAMNMLWPSRKSQVAGGIAGTPTKIDIMDVGSVDLDAGNLFVESAAKGGSDPLLGPYASLLDSYVDHRSRIGWAMQAVTTEVIAGSEATP